MTLKQAAAILGITPDSLRQAIARGTLKATKRGRDWWVTQKAVDDYRKHKALERGVAYTIDLLDGFGG